MRIKIIAKIFDPIKEDLSNKSEVNISKIIKVLRKLAKGMPKPMTSVVIEKYGKDPFLILISCLLSLRTRDAITLPVCLKLFSLAKTPQEILQIPIKKLEALIYPVGFYRKKAKLLHSVSNEIIKKFDGVVPNDQNDLLSIKGVGLKTANLVLSQAFGIPAICVDTHVHKISNQLGIVNTKDPIATEAALKKVIPQKYWIEWGRLLVTLGQNYSRKEVAEICNKIGFKK